MVDIKKEHQITVDIFKYHDMLFQLYEFLGHDIVLKSGAVKRVFYDRSYDDIVFEFQSGRKDYVMDCDTDFSIGAIKTFEMEYPDVYKDFMKTYKMYDDSECIEITAADLMKMDSLPEN
jgi:hypothetical protein